MTRFVLDYKNIAQSLIDNYQSNFPLVAHPYSEIATNLQTTEAHVMRALSQLLSTDVVGRIGPIYKTHRVGHSLLAACACEDSRLDEVAAIISEFKEVNHNYERENVLNLWFVVTGKDEDSVLEVCRSIEEKCGLKVLRFPMIKPYKIDLSVTDKIDWDLV